MQLVLRNVSLHADPHTAKMANEAAPECERGWQRGWVPFYPSQRDRSGPAWLILATTGMRRGEALGLRWTDINLDGLPARATVRRAAIVIQHRRELNKTKTGKDRVFELDAHSVDGFKVWKARQRKSAFRWGRTTRLPITWSSPFPMGVDTTLRGSRGSLNGSRPRTNRLHPDAPLPPPFAASRPPALRGLPG